MRRSIGSLVAAGLLAGCASLDGADPYGGAGVGVAGPGIRWSGPYGADPFYRSYPGSLGRPYGYGVDPFGRSVDPFDRGYYGRGGGRTFRPGGDVVCDRRTETCYRRGQIDASETRDYFGRGAARRVDRIRDQAGTNRIFRADDNVV
ncbi:MAG TPA: hypothetical protein VFY87_09020, partial [Geminicoccaceae bacterium]|nr:hypothetical protein [Geminicoccaceae bacterium]